MTGYAIDSERTSFTVTFKPSLPGMRATVSGVTGDFDARVVDGAVDWSAPVGGAFRLHVEDLSMGNALLTAGVRRFLEATRSSEITGELGDVEPDGRDRFLASVAITLGERRVPVRTTGRFEADRDDDGHELLRVAGRSICDPRAFGVPLPPLVNFVVHVHWKLVLRPT